MSVNKKTEKKNFEWHDQQEKILKKWSEMGASYRYLHDRSYAYYNKQNFRFALPVIVLSTITGTANFALKSFPEAWRETVPLVIGFLNLSAGLITTVSQFLRVSELLEGHRAASISYSKFSRNISVELSLPIKERTCSGTEFINKSRADLDRLIEQSPSVPMFIVKEFGHRFKDDEFVKPEILEIKSVEIYKDEHDIDKRNKLIEEEKKIRERIINEEKTRRMSLIKEIVQEKEIHENKLKKEEKEKKKKRKETVKIGNVQKKMQDLILKLEMADKKGTVVTPSSSDDDTSLEDSESNAESNTDNTVIDINDGAAETVNENETTEVNIEEMQEDIPDNLVLDASGNKL